VPGASTPCEFTIPPFCDGEHIHLTPGAYVNNQEKPRGVEEKTMLGFEVVGLAFLALLFTAAQFCWLLERAKPH